MSEYTTIVIKHKEGGRPIDGFAVEVLGCEVTSLAIGDQLERLDGALVKIDKIEDIAFDKEMVDAWDSMCAIQGIIGGA